MGIFQQKLTIKHYLTSGPSIAPQPSSVLKANHAQMDGGASQAPQKEG
jgi:hypothetical protein